MKYLLIAVVSFVSVIATPVQAEASTREEVFMYLWSTIYRPVYDTYETPFTDVSENRASYRTITWGKRRGILDDESQFFPDQLASRTDTVLWLLRTQNVDSIDQLERENLEVYIERYPSLQSFMAESTVPSLEEVQALYRAFKQERDSEVHEISFYSEKFQGKGTAFGESFDMHALTAAHPSFPHNTLVRVTNLENNQSVIVRVNDRGPFVHGRSMDLSLASFLQLTERASGVLREVTIERLGDHELYPLSDEDRQKFYGQAQEDRESQDSQADEEKGIQAVAQEADPIPELPFCSRFANYYQKRLTPSVHFQRGIPHVLSIDETIHLKANQYFVVRGLRINGEYQPVEQWIDPMTESFDLTPTELGEYELLISDGARTLRSYEMSVENCL